MQVSVFSNYNWPPHAHARETSKDSTKWPSMEELTYSITFCQRAFSSGNNVLLKIYQNKETEWGKYFASKVIKLKQTNPKTWSSEVKRLSGMASAPDELLDQLHIDNTQDLSPNDFADLINNSLIEPERAYNPLDTSNISTLLDEIHKYPNLNTNLTDTDSVKEVKKPQPVYSTRPWWYWQLNPERIHWLSSHTSYHAPTQCLM